MSATDEDTPQMAVDDVSARPSLGDLLARLVDEIRALFDAEFALYRAEAIRRSLSVGIAAGFILGALTLAQGALIALLVGLVMFIAPSVGTGLAIVVVVGGALAIAAALAWVGLRKINRIIDPDKPS